MAKSGNFTFTNTTATTYKTLPLFDMDEVANYGLKGEYQDKSTLINADSDSDARELLSYFCSYVGSVGTALRIQNPSPIAMSRAKKKAVQYGVILEATHVETDSNDASYRVDRPVKVLIQIQQEDAASITDAQIKTLLGRAISALFKANGDSRLPDLRGHALRVTAS